MLRISSLTFIFLIVIFASCDTASNVDPAFKRTFVKYYGTEGDQFPSDLQVNPDGSILILANSISLSGETTPFVIKTDYEGNVIWERTVGGANQSAVDIEPIMDGVNDKFVIALNEQSGLASKIKLLKITINGDTSDNVYLKMHSNGYRQVVRSVTSLTTSNEFVVTGLADRTLVEETSPVNESNDQSDILAFRLDNSFNFMEKIVDKGGELNGCGIRITELEGINAGKLALFSYTDRPYVSDAFGYNFSFDILNEGTPVGKLIGSETDQEVLSTVLKVPFLSGGGFLMAGTTRAAVDGPGRLYLVKYDEEFQQKALDIRISLEKNLECKSAANASSGYYLLADEQVEGSFRDVILIKVTREGDVEWTQSFGTQGGDDSSAAISTLPDGRIVVAASMELETKKKIALIVLNSTGRF
jgi:hypothetical protein